MKVLLSSYIYILLVLSFFSSLSKGVYISDGPIPFKLWYTYKMQNKTFYKVVNDPRQVKPSYPTSNNLFEWLNPKSRVRFRLWSRQNPHFAQEIKYGDVSSLETSNFDRRKLTKFIIHGFADGASEANIGDWMIFMRDAYLKLADVNIIIVDYSIHALVTRYLSGSPETVAARITEMLNFLTANGATLASFHLIGWSWGAQISGLVGHSLNGTLSRITGIDPAGPTFKFVDNEFRLDKSDAEFVDILHVNGGTRLFWGAHFGLQDPLGHVDVYANSGERQTGCPKERVRIFETLWCSHGRGPKYWTESITSPLAFPVCPCNTLDQYVKGECVCNKDTIAYWGEHMPHETRGIFQMITRSHEPFGHGPKLQLALPNMTEEFSFRGFDGNKIPTQSATVELNHTVYQLPFENTYFNTKDYPNSFLLNMSLSLVRNVSNYNL